MVLQQNIGAITYFSPGSNWDRVIAKGTIIGVTIINPNSGPGTSQDSSYASQTAASQAASIPVLGYVHTSYGARAMADVKLDIDRHYSFYGVNGIFIDEADSSGSQLSYYAEIYNYIKSKPGGGRVAINPGSKTTESYATVADHIMVFESSAAEYRTRTPSSWEPNYPASKFWHAIHTTQASDVNEMITLSRQRNAGLVFITDDVMPNPYDVLPSYWDSLITNIVAANGGSVEPLPVNTGGNVTLPPVGDSNNDGIVNNADGSGGSIETTSSPAVIDNPRIPQRSVQSYTWKTCPFSTYYVERYLVPDPPPRTFYDGSKTAGGPGTLLLGTSTNLVFVQSLIGTKGESATAHTNTQGGMVYRARGWTCFDDNCYYYTHFGTRYHEE